MAPLVGVIMGSDSDLPVMKAACEMLEKFEIEYECTIVSAHRTPDRLVEYARSARRRGLKVIVAGVRCADTIVHSYSILNFSSISQAAFMTGRSLSLPMITPTSGAIVYFAMLTRQRCLKLVAAAGRVAAIPVNVTSGCRCHLCDEEPVFCVVC